MKRRPARGIVRIGETADEVDLQPPAVARTLRVIHAISAGVFAERTTFRQATLAERAV